MKFAAEFANWVKQSDGGFVLTTGDSVLAQVHPVNGLWRTTWYGRRAGTSYLSQQFQTAHEACLASEKNWPSNGDFCGIWLESKNGGYFRQFGNRCRVYLRQGDHGWYAVQTDGKLLGKGANVSWFRSALDAALAVQAQRHTPIDADPFRNGTNDWRWLKLKNPARAA